jgi:hypothetical protein
MTTTLFEPESPAETCNFTAVVRRTAQQLPLFSRRLGNPGPWRHSNHAASWLEIARALPASLGLEFTADGWRIITVPHEMRRALEALDIAEGDVIPDAVMRERRRRVVEAELLVVQAKAVLRAVNLELQAKAA